MQLSDFRDIAAPPETVWAAILNPEVLKACIPGCESMTGSPETGYEAVVVQKVGPVSARFTGLVKLSDIIMGQAVTISGEGKGGPAGYAKGGAKVTLAAQGDGTGCPMWLTPTSAARSPSLAAASSTASPKSSPTSFSKISRPRWNPRPTKKRQRTARRMTPTKRKAGSAA